MATVILPRPQSSARPPEAVPLAALGCRTHPGAAPAAAPARSPLPEVSRGLGQGPAVAAALSDPRPSHSRPFPRPAYFRRRSRARTPRSEPTAVVRDYLFAQTRRGTRAEPPPAATRTALSNQSAPRESAPRSSASTSLYWPVHMPINPSFLVGFWEGSSKLADATAGKEGATSHDRVGCGLREADILVSMWKEQTVDMVNKKR